MRLPSARKPGELAILTSSASNLPAPPVLGSRFNVPRYLPLRSCKSLISPLRTTISEPSGDQAGNLYQPASSVSRSGAPPCASTRQTWHPSYSFQETKHIDIHYCYTTG